MANHPKRCLYEVLGVAQDASPSDIRSAYRRLALQLHPDKLKANPNSSSSDSTALFQELQHAYEVLSDPKERAYYDSHRSQILFSDLSNSKSNSSFFDLNLFGYFSTSAFSGFTDTGRGFYKVYGDLFTKIYSQEVAFATRMGMGSDSVAPPPLMGNLDSPYQQVTAFYNYWLGFCTVLDFAWADEYDPSFGANRRSRRLMEEENKKLRKKARREYNDSVRGLAAFVKKRDERVVRMMVKKKKEEERKKKEAMEKKKEEERRKLEKAKAYEEPEWSRIEETDEFEEVLGYDDEEFGSDKRKKKGGGEEFYCVACNKKFKSDKQWKNHEQSKKHREKVSELRLVMEVEDEILMEKIGEEVNGGFDYEPAPEESASERDIDELCEDFGDNLEMRNEEIDGEQDEVSEESILQSMISGQRGRKNSAQSGEKENPSSNSFSCLDEEEENDDERSKRKGRKNRKGKRQENDVGKEKENGDDENGNMVSSSLSEEVRTDGSEGKREKKNTGNKEKQKAKSESPSYYCDMCEESFESRLFNQMEKFSSSFCWEGWGYGMYKGSEVWVHVLDLFQIVRNKLFSHLSETGHAALKQQSRQKAKKASKR
ncbi:dnaJ subfamily C member 21 [Carex littledalei]|uniref:DnaJ subfamily C member 21 n=1 Tax=Carex littledalei TaxID=544730 RepID=A0A833R486_9POAL|nr:dnaJ subfamily C member 21 [Carex littledalei]